MAVGPAGIMGSVGQPVSPGDSPSPSIVPQHDSCHWYQKFAMVPLLAVA